MKISATRGLTICFGRLVLRNIRLVKSKNMNNRSATRTAQWWCAGIDQKYQKEREMVRPRSCCYLCPASTQVSLKQYQQVKQTSGSVNGHICYTQRYTPVWLLLPEIIPPYPSQSHDFKKGTKGLSCYCICFFDCANNLAFIAEKAHGLTLLH